jgi:hypothetical protein
MKTSQQFWRGLFFILLITALCGGLALPVIEGEPARAAPQMQATACLGTTITQWTFLGDVITPSTGTGTFMQGPGLPAPTFAGGNPDRAVSFDTWTSTLDTSKYIDLVVPTSGRNSIRISFDYRATGTGPNMLELHYSTDGSSFTLFSSPSTLNNNSTFQSLSFDLSTITGLNDNSNAVFRLYAYGASGGSGTLRLDNITFTGNCLFPANTDTPTPTSTNTNTSTAGAALSVIINEVAWAGTLANSDDEWIELYNPGSSPVNITGWQLYGDDNISNTVGSPNITLAGTIPANGYFLLERVELAVSDVIANQIYSTGGLLNSGERLYLKDSSGNIIDTANSDGGAWPAGVDSPTYASMERLGTANQWVTYGGTVPVAHDRSNNAIKGTPGRANWITSATITTITADTPDPSAVNQNVTVSVTVIGGTTAPTGTVSITGADPNCTITLSSGAGSCIVRFTTSGSKTLTATYGGDPTHPASSDTESHSVTATAATPATPVPTARPSPLPPPPLIGINEFVPRPGHDWNNDGVINVGDEYIELINHGVIDVSLSGYSLDDEVNIGSSPFSLPSITLKPGERRVFYGSETGLLLSDGGDGVRLLKPGGQLGDAYNYFVVRFPDQSYCRLPDNGGLDDWNQNCFPTPGLQNSLSVSSVNPPTSGGDEMLCPIADTLPQDFVLAECLPFGNNIWNSAYWDENGWYEERYLPGSPGKWNVFVD